MSNIMGHLISWYPIGRSSLHFSQTSNSGRSFFISLIIASHHSVLLLSLSISIASFTVFGTLIPYLCVLIQNLCVFEMIRSRFLRTYFTQHTNAGSSYIRFSTENSDIWTGYKYFTSFSVCQVGLAYLQWIQTYHPFFVFTIIFVNAYVCTHASCCSNYVLSVLVSVIDSSIVNRFPAWSTCANKFPAMRLDDKNAVQP